MIWVGGPGTFQKPGEPDSLPVTHSKIVSKIGGYLRLGRQEMPAQQLWGRIVDAQMETGTPFMLYKDLPSQSLSPYARVWRFTPGGSFFTAEFQNDYDLRDVYRNCFTGLGRLGNICRNSGVSSESEL